jgi:long-subunit fatty acid transport protein
MSLGFYHVSYEGTTRHTEVDANNSTDFNNFTYTEEIDVEGNGFNLSIGTMVRLLKIMRIGASLQLPTFYRIDEAYRNTINNEFDNGDLYDFDAEGEFGYKLTTPLRLTGGASVQLGKSGIISADVEYVNYAGMILKDLPDEEEDFLGGYNDQIETVYRSVVNLKLGGEARLFENMFVRLGGGFYPSPYTSQELNSDASYTELTAGLGYRSSSFFIDFGFSSLLHKEKYSAYSAYNYLSPNNLVNNLSNFDQTMFRFVASMGFRF